MGVQEKKMLFGEGIQISQKGVGQKKQGWAFSEISGAGGDLVGYSAKFIFYPNVDPKKWRTRF